MNEGQEYESYIRSDSSVESFTICFAPDFVNNALLCLNNNTEEMLNLSADNRESLSREYRFSEKLFSHERYLIPHFSIIRKSLQEHRYNYAAYPELLHMILDKLISQNKEFNNGSAIVQKYRFSTRKELFKRLNIAKDFIDSSFNLKIELNEVSKAAGLSEHYMLREFKKLFDLTPYQYLTARRLDEAKNLLVNSNNSVTQISLLVGFEYLSSFTKLFTRRFKISPHKFRENKS
jgi:AraC-like DNA-binding protein